MDDDHLRKEQLFPLLHALRERPAPPVEGEGADPEMARMLRDLPDAFTAHLPPDQRLGPDTVDRLLLHTRTCTPCRGLLIEDGPGARPKKTEADVKAEVDRKESERKAKVKRFWIGASGGAAAFIAAQGTFHVYRNKTPVESVTGDSFQQDRSDEPMKIDPLLILGMGFVLIAAFCLTDAYVIARELWIDFTKWKRAVPVIGRAWADRDKKAED